MTHGYLTLCIDSLVETTRITILEDPFTGQKGWVDAIVFQQPTGSEERAFCYQVTLDLGSGLKSAGTMSHLDGSVMMT
jgi:hypothetical protein